MAKIYHKRMVSTALPVWLQNVGMSVDSLANVITLQGDARDYHNLLAFIDAEIDAQRSRGNIRCTERVETELRTVNGRTEIMLLCNRYLLQIYFIE